MSASIVFISVARRCAGERLRRMVVNHAARRRFERRRDGTAAASATSSSSRRVKPSGVCRADRRLEEEKELILPLGQTLDASEAGIATSCSCCRLTTAAGCSRAEVRYTQSSGH